MRKTALSLALFGLAATLWAADPFVGTWKMNPAKSAYSLPLDKSYTITIAAQDNGCKVVQDFVTADEKALRRSWSAKYDGKFYPVTAPDADAISLKKPTPNTVEYVLKKNGKEAWSGRAAVSADGRTMTDKGGGKDANGKPFTYSLFMERQ